MPEEAPGMTARLRRLFLLSDECHETVDRLQHAWLRAALVGAHGVAARYRHGRRAVDLVGHRLLDGALDLALHAERLHGVHEFLRIDTVLLQPLAERGLVVGAQAPLVDGVEEWPMKLLQHSHCLEGKEDGRDMAPARVEDVWHAAIFYTLEAMGVLEKL